MDVKIFLIGGGVVLAAVIYKLLRRSPKGNFQEYYNEILTSEEYKIKGQFD